MRASNAIRHFLARTVRRSSLLTAIKNRLGFGPRPIEFGNSQQYWEQRYQKGGDSGEGSYGKLARYKADVINSFAQSKGIQTAIEFGCGDGNQASLLQLPSYTGIDISKKCVDECTVMLGPRGYEFKLLKDYLDSRTLSAYDLSLSLDVIYHLVEDAIFAEYIANLLGASKKYSLIYASNFDLYEPSLPHVRHRNFVDHIAKFHPEWSLITVYPNPLLKPHDSKEYGSFAQFHLFEKNATSK